MKLPLLFTLSVLVCFDLFAAGTYGQRIVAAVLVAEAGIEGREGTIAVAEVIRNSADDRGITMLAEVQRRARYTPVTKAGGVDNLLMKYSKSHYYKEALEVAKIAYNTPEKLPGVTKGATFFHLTNMPPYWAKGMKPVATVGRHHFYVTPRNQRKNR